MNIKSIRNNRRFQRKVGEYPCCDYLNNALMFLLQQKEISNGSKTAIDEICWAIYKGNGYVYRHVLDLLWEKGLSDCAKRVKLENET